MPRCKLQPLLAFSLLISTLCSSPVQAMGVHFSIDKTVSPKTTATAPQISVSSQPIQPTSAIFDASEIHPPQPLLIPREATSPPISSNQAQQPLPKNVVASARVLTPPPIEALPTARVFSPPQASPAKTPAAIGLNFPTAHTLANNHSLTETLGRNRPTLPQWIYEGGSNSLVARVIGSAEGTRTPSGQPTRAYYGHTDPGNGVWNMGTFSYQHGAASPHEADDKQLKRLQKQGKNIEHQAKQADLSMSLGEVLNGLDLANQAPRAALDRGGYVDRLVQARQKGMSNDDAIVWARTYAYLDPDTQRWNAPGLGNTLPSIQRDQNRRHQAISQAFEHYLAQRDTTDQPPTNSLQAPALALASPPPTTSPLQSLDTPQEKQDIEHLPAPAIAPVEFSMAEISVQESAPVDENNSQAQATDTVQIRS